MSPPRPPPGFEMVDDSGPPAPPEGFALLDPQIPSFLAERGQLQPDGTYVVETPQGPVRFTSKGKEILSEADAEARANIGEESTKEAVLTQALSGANAGAKGFLPQLAGIEEASKVSPLEALPTYRKVRDAARRDVQAADEKAGLPAQLIGGVLGAPVAPGTALARVGLSAGLSAAQQVAESDVDLTNATQEDLKRLAGETLKAGAIGAGAGVLGEGAGAVLRKASEKVSELGAAALAKRTTSDAAAVEKEIASLAGKLGSESQQASRSLENLQRGVNGITEGAEGAVSDELRDAAKAALQSEGGARLQEKVLQRNLAELPGKQATIERLEGELAAKTAGAAEEAAQRTKDYFSAPLWQTEVLPRLKLLAPRFGLASAAYVVSGGDEKVGAGAFAGAVLGAPGVRQMMKNVATSPRVQAAIASKLAPLLEGAANAVTRGVVPTLRELLPMVANEHELGDPALAAEGLVARGGMKSLLGPGKADPALDALNAPQSEIDKALSQTVGITTMGAALEEQQKTIDAGLKRIMKGEKTPPPSRDTKVPNLTPMSADPQAMLDRITTNLGDLSNIAPTVAQQMTATAQRAADYMAKVSATPAIGGPLAPKWVPSSAERRQVALAGQTVENPLGILEYAAAGTLAPEQVQALNAVYPMLGRQLADSALSSLEPGKPMPYRARLMVALLAGVDVDGSLSSVAANQQAIHAQSQKPSNQGAPTKSKGIDKLTVAQRTASSEQRREEDRES